jgi:hypothetical protein
MILVGNLCYTGVFWAANIEYHLSNNWLITVRSIWSVLKCYVACFESCVTKHFPQTNNSNKTDTEYDRSDIYSND